MKRSYWLILSWVFVLSVAAMIFIFSAQEGAESSQISSGITQWLLHLLYPRYDQLSPADKNTLLGSWQFALRKAAHFSEFALLGISLKLLFRLLVRQKPSLLAWIVGTLYACTDELHQTVVSDRAGMWQDVCIDSAGVLFGVLAVLLILSLRKRRKKVKHQ